MDRRNSNIGPTGGLGCDKMFTKAFTSRDAEDWEVTSDATNPVESINRQSFKSKNNLNVILENIYLEDRIHTVKMVPRSRDVNISYSVDSNKRKNRKRKRTSLVADAETFKQHDANGPPNKAEKHQDSQESATER